MADQREFGRDRSAGIHGKPSGLGGSHRGRRDWISGALVSDRMGTRCGDRVHDRYRMSGNNFVGDGVPAHVHCDTGGAFHVASLPATAGISGFISPDGAGPVGIGHRVPGTVL